MIKNPVIYLNHILDCINKIQVYTKGMNQGEFLNNPLIQDGVIRNLEIIGEATRQLSQSAKSEGPAS